jgi:DNA-directed RNA polymerase specialized sigma24 family protein
MNENPDQPSSKSAGQQEFLRVFLANEREILRYVIALVPNIGDAQEIVQQTALVLWEKFHEYDSDRPFAPWACRFALNVTRQWMDRRRRWKALLEGGLAEELALRREQLQPEFDARLTHLTSACVSCLTIIANWPRVTTFRKPASRDWLIRRSEKSRRFTRHSNASDGNYAIASSVLSARRRWREVSFS